MRFTKVTLVATFAVALAIGNVTAAKIAFFNVPLLGDVPVSAGFVAIGLVFLCTDIIGELYGEETARATVNGGIVTLVIAYLLIYVAIAMPIAPFYDAHEAYVRTFGASSSIVIASVVTLLVSQNLDVTIFHWLKRQTGGKYSWFRNIFSTAVSQFLDTSLFTVLAFVIFPGFLGGEMLPLASIPMLVLGEYIMKTVIVWLDTPIFLFIVWVTENKQRVRGVTQQW